MLGESPPLPLFAYGTLTDPVFVGRLLEHAVVDEAAVLMGFRELELVRLGYRAVVPEDGAEVEGRLYRGLGAADYERLDAYEGLAEGLYARQTAQARTSRSTEPVAVYVPTPRTLRRHA